MDGSVQPRQPTDQAVFCPTGIASARSGLPPRIDESSFTKKRPGRVAEEMGEATPYAMQHLLDRARWDGDRVRDELRASIQEMLVSPHAVLVIDETGFLKKGGKSVGVLPALKTVRLVCFLLTRVHVD